MESYLERQRIGKGIGIPRELKPKGLANFPHWYAQHRTVSEAKMNVCQVYNSDKNG